MSRSHVLVDVRRCTYRVGVAAALTMAPLAFQFSAAEVVEPTAAAAMEKFLARPTLAHQYSASRRLEASGSGQRAWLDVQTHFTLESGLRYEVTAEGGSGYIRSRILRSLLDEEQRLIARGGSAGVAVSAANYQFKSRGRQRGGPGRGGAEAATKGSFALHWPDVSDGSRRRSRANGGTTRQEPVVLGHPCARGSIVSTDQRGAHASLTGDDGPAQAAWIVSAAYDVSLLAHRRTASQR